MSGIDCPKVAAHHVLVASADLGHRIRRARESMGWNQQDLADALTRQRDGRRVGVRSIGRWERGETVPRNATGALEAVLGVSLDGDAGEPDPREEELRDLGKDRGGFLEAAEVEDLIRRYRQRMSRRRAPGTRAS